MDEEIVFKPIGYIKSPFEDVGNMPKSTRESMDVEAEIIINEEYLESVRACFRDDSFRDSISLLAYMDGKVVGRIDSTMIKSRFDGSTKAYLDWICVVKNYRHRGVAQALMAELRKQLKERGIDTMIALTASNEEAQRFYKSVPDSSMHDIGIWIDIK